MRGWILLIGVAFSTAAARGEDVSWTSAVSLWKSLSTNGQVIDAGPAPSWGSPPPAAIIGRLPPMPRPAPEGTPRPRELPDGLVEPKGPHLPSAKIERPTPDPAPQPIEEFASERSVVPQVKQTQAAINSSRATSRPPVRLLLPRR